MVVLKIMVTGASGFVGTSLCNRLSSLGIKFSGTVRKKTRPEQFEIGELSAQTDWSEALTDCDVIIHLAARVHVMKDTSHDPLAAFRAVNVDATLNLAKQALRCGVKRFVYVSSVKVNGEETISKSFTAFDVPAPIDPYGQSKLEAEIELRALLYQSGLELVIIRPPLVYGPGVRANFFKLMQLVKMSVPLPLGAIHNKRSMVALDNLLDLLITCAHHPAAAGQIFMVSDDHDVSISELLRLLSSGMDQRSLLLPVPAWMIAGVATLMGKSASANRLLGSLQVDIAHTKSTLDWQPVVSMPDALRETVEHFLAHH